ncbi:O-antigen ligase domain-containing protein [bacterium]|nr:O-antigen ligase domain-containing protein [bacterium]
MFLCVFLSYKRMQLKKTLLISSIFVFLAFNIVFIVLGGDYFGNRNVVFIFYIVFALLFISIKWNYYEIKFFDTCIVLGAIVVMLIVFFSADFSSEGRLYITIGREIDQNYLSANLLFATAILSRNIVKKRRRKISFVLLIANFIAIFILGSRSGLLGNLAVVWCYIIATKKNAWKYTLILAAIYLLIFGAFVSYLPEWIVSRFAIKNLITSTGSGRTIIWKYYWQTYKNGSFLHLLIGYGRGSIYGSIYRLATHNMYLKSLIEGGLIGFTLFIYFFVILLRNVFRYKNYLGIAVVFGFMVSGMFLDLDDYRVFPVLIMFTQMHNKFFPYQSKVFKIIFSRNNNITVT